MSSLFRPRFPRSEMVATAAGEKLLIGRAALCLFLCRKLHLFLRKSTKTAATGAALFDCRTHQIVCRFNSRRKVDSEFASRRVTNCTFSLRPRQGARSIVTSVSVCLSVCVCVFVCQRSYLGNYTSDLHQFLCLLPMAVARSSSGGAVIRYVFAVLWMTPLTVYCLQCFDAVGWAAGRASGL